jgi:DNA-binding MarR family transcriptional regulator
MVQELGKLIDELGMRMRLLRATQENGAPLAELSERDILLLELLDGRGRMTVSEIAAAYPHVSESTISTDITHLWRNKKLVSKTINPDNQRITFVELTEKGRETLSVIRRQRTERLATLFRAMGFSDEERQVMERVTSRAIEYFDEHLGLKKKAPPEPAQK